MSDHDDAAPDKKPKRPSVQLPENLRGLDVSRAGAAIKELEEKTKRIGDQFDEPFRRLRESIKRTDWTTIPDPRGFARPEVGPSKEVFLEMEEARREAQRAQAQRDEVQIRQADALEVMKDEVTRMNTVAEDERKAAQKRARHSFIMQCLIFAASLSGVVVAVVALSRSG